MLTRSKNHHYHAQKISKKHAVAKPKSNKHATHKKSVTGNGEIKKPVTDVLDEANTIERAGKDIFNLAKELHKSDPKMANEIIFHTKEVRWNAGLIKDRAIELKTWDEENDQQPSRWKSFLNTITFQPTTTPRSHKRFF
jgi:hypothetical protein